MKRIFVVSWFYPPLNSSEGLVTAKLLGRSQYHYDVFTESSCEQWSYGRSAALPETDNVHRIESRASTPSAFADEAFRYFQSHTDSYSLVMTRSMPPECHAAGLRIKETFPAVPWLASFGDPIKDNPYRHLDETLYSSWSLDSMKNRKAPLSFRLSPRRFVHEALWLLRHRTAVRERQALGDLEEQTVQRAERILVNNRSELRYLLPEHLRQKAVLLRHSYEPALYDALPRRESGEPTRFVFTGALDEQRSAAPLLEAIAELKADCADLPARAVFDFYGTMAEHDLAAIVRLGLTGLVRYSPPTGYLDSLRQLAAADWALHIDADLSAVWNENVFFAAKLADCFGAHVPVFAIGMPRGDVTRCLERAGMVTVGFSVGEIKQALYEILYQGRRAEPDWDRIAAEFDARRVAACLDQTIREVLNDGS